MDEKVSIPHSPSFPSPTPRIRRDGHRTTIKSKNTYKKLLWFRQPFPDNYTDSRTFLSHLQRNARLQPYEFWALMLDGTTILQHLASVTIFCCCFVAIIQAKVSPVTVVLWTSVCTVVAWGVGEWWVEGEIGNGSESSGTGMSKGAYEAHFTSRKQSRITTIKSAALIYAALLGLSPLLKSLTLSTTSDSIWALATWLLMVNVAFFDYSGGSKAQLPASISTNSAMMASAVLASRLSSTTHVFSLTLFSIQVFGLFPIFRGQLRSHSKRGHIALTILLVITAWGGVFVTLTGGGRVAFACGMVLGSAITFLGMGMGCWWLIGLQKYKNEITGPWDPAKPIIRRRWD